MCATNLYNSPHRNLSKYTNYNVNNTLHDLSCKSKTLSEYSIPISNVNKQESFAGIDSKYFLPPIGTFQLSPAEYNEIIMKRASLCASEKTDSISEQKYRPYSCVECGKTFIQKHHLTMHRKIHSGIKPHACIHCGKAFTHKHCLNTHLLLHSSDRPYECTECKKSFTLKHHLISHAKVHSREKPFLCTECGCRFPLKRHLVTHKKFHAGERPFTCVHCNESFAQKEHLAMHSRFHGSLNSFVCQECGAQFTRKFELVNHNRIHGNLPLNCSICNKEFLQKRTLILHMRIHSNDRVHNCPNCPEAFLSYNDFLLHIKKHSPQKLACSECSSSFNSPEALALHVKLHTSDASLIINDLSMLASNLTPNRYENNNLTTQETKIKPHVCKFCLKSFSAKHGLQQHSKKNPEGACTLKSHVCEACNKAFYQKNHLLLHQRQHMDPNLRSVKRSGFDTNKTENVPCNNETSLNLLSVSAKVLSGDDTIENLTLNKSAALNYDYSTVKFRTILHN